jgi:hypothetical protein
MYDMSSEADRNILKAREEAQKESKELNYQPKRYVPDEELLKKRMDAWDRAAYDALNPQLTQVSDTSMHGKKVASALRDKLVKNIEDAAKKGDIEATEKAQEKLKDHDDKQLPPPEGFPDPTKDPDAYQDFDVSQQDNEWMPKGDTKVARYKKPTYTPPYVQDWDSLGGGGRRTSPTGGNLKDWDPNKKIQASIPQQDFGTLSSFYGGQGVDAATLASTASQTRKKKKKTTVTSSYKPRGSMITEKRKLKSPNDWFNPDDIKPEHPKDPPPEMVNNYHPDLVDSSKTAERFNKLDPATAKAMPKQDDPNIDAKVEKAKNNPDKDGPGWHKQVSDKIRKARAQQRKGSGYSDDNESNGGNGEG